MKHRRFILLAIGNLIAILILFSEVKAQSVGFIYGRVTTVDGTYEGRIRWGKEETYWHHYFNAAKLDNPSRKKYLGKKDKEDWTEFDWKFKSIWEDKHHLVHQFSCQFGDIKSMEIISHKEVIVTLKNSVDIRLNGEGYNDIGTSIYLFKNSGDKIGLDWKELKRVDFYQAPRSFTMEMPLYGTVETYRKGKFTGLIEWDHDEVLGSEKLDGKYRGESMSILFSDIETIIKKGEGSLVTTRDGRSYFLTGSNDVAKGHRGVIVTVPDLGRVDIPWVYFKSLELAKPNDEISEFQYKDFSKPRGIHGTVYMIDGEVSGRIIYDLDEEWEMETLDAEDDGVEYEIPFRNVASIVPKNYAYSLVKARNGETYLVGDSRDVDSNNDGLLIITRDDREVYVPWKEVLEIVFD